jgi:biopolymer transport protein ExbB/TolQ
MKTKSNGLATFFIIWIGQLVSLLGTKMTRFALLIWIYQETGQATAIALLGFFGWGAAALCSPFAGYWVDKWDKRRVMLWSDFGAGIMTIFILIVMSQSELHLWHLYLATVDGTESKDLREIMEVEIHQESSRREAEAKVLEAAGGYAPTIGIIGAVLGLIQVMKHLENIEEVGHGIAVAFVATIYGVGIANIVLLPGAKRMISRIEQVAVRKELMLEGVICLTEGLNPRLNRFKLGGYLDNPTEDDEELGGSPGRAPEVQHAAQK